MGGQLLPLPSYAIWVTRRAPPQACHLDPVFLVLETSLQA